MTRAWTWANAGLFLALSAGLVACGGDDSSAEGEAGSSEGEAGSGEELPGTETGFDPPEGECGNGFVEDEEECDDGNQDDEDGCSNSCLSQIPCGIEWSALRAAPTQASDIGGVQIVREAGGGFVVAGFVQENIVEQDMSITEGDVEVLLQRYDAAGRPGWSRSFSEQGVDLGVGGLAIDGGGTIYLGLNHDLGSAGSDLSVRALSGSDGAELWSFVYDTPMVESEDLVMGLAVAADGGLLISGQVPVAAGDDDAWLRKVSALDGVEIWTETVSGAFDNGFSVDKGGPLASAPDGSVYLFMEEYVNFETVEATLVKFGPEGGPPLWTFTPLAGGPPHRHLASLITTDADSQLFFLIERGSPAPTFWLYKISGDQELEWVLEPDDLDPEERGYTVSGLAVADDGSILTGGRWINENQFEGTQWSELWFTRLSPDAEPLCSSIYQAPSEGLLPASVSPAQLSASAAGGAVFTGTHELEDSSSLWTAQFGPE